MTFERLRWATKVLAARPLHALVLTATVAVSVGATAAVSSIVYRVLVRPLPYPQQERLIRLSEQRSGEDIALFDARLSLGTYEAWRASARTLEYMATYDPRRMTVGLPGDAQSVVGAQVSPAFFLVFGSPAAAGRLFDADETVPGVVLGFAFWRDRLGQDPAVVGRSLTIDGLARVVVGIAPDGFAFPARESAIWTNSVRPIDPARRASATYLVIARSSVGATISQIEAEGREAARAAGWRVDSADVAARTPQSVVVSARQLLADVTASARRPLQLIASGVILLVLAGAANVATVLLSLHLSRRREFAIRVAVGATSGDLLRQVLIEAVIVVGTGTGLGLLIAYGMVQWLSSVAPPGLARAAEIGLDWRGLAAAGVVSLGMLAVTVALPAIRGTRIDILGLFGRRGDGITALHSRVTTGLHRLLLGCQAAMATVLMVASLLLTHSFVALVNNDPGYRASGVLVGQLYLPATQADRKQQFLNAMLDRVRTLPGVTVAGGGNMMPFSDALYLSEFELGARQTEGKPTAVRAVQYVVTPGYAEALGLRLREGRLFRQEDVGSATATALVNEAFVQRHLSSAPVAGRMLLRGLGSIGTATEIIGVVGNVLKDGFDQAPRPEIYLLFREELPIGRDLNVAIRTSGDPAALGPSVRQIVRETDATAALAQIQPLTERVSSSVAQRRFATLLFVGLALDALALACVGLYGSVAANVSARMVEMSIRYALGATRQRLIVHALSAHFTAAAVGMVIGLAGAVIVAGTLRSMLFGIGRLEVLSFVAGSAVVLMAALCACLVPALRAAGNDPAMTVRGA